MGAHAVRAGDQAGSAVVAACAWGEWRQVGGAGDAGDAGEHTMRAAGRRGRGVQRRTGGRVAQLPELPFFVVGPAWAAGDFGLSRLRYDSPSITRS